MGCVQVAARKGAVLSIITHFEGICFCSTGICYKMKVSGVNLNAFEVVMCHEQPCWFGVTLEAPTGDCGTIIHEASAGYCMASFIDNH